MKNFITSIKTPLKILIISAVVILGTQMALAWTNPTNPAPDGNVPAPVNVGGAGQIKSGGLTVAWDAPSNNIGFVVKNGYVGIGTATPNALLNVQQSSGAGDFVHLRDNTSGSDFYINFDGTNKYIFNSEINGTGVNWMTFLTGGTVGINTTTPNTTVKLGVNGNVGASAYCDVNGANCSTPPFGGGGLTGSGTTGKLSKWTGSTSLGNSGITEGGNGGSQIGVNNSNPWYKLDTIGYIRATSGFCIGGSGTTNDGDCITSWPTGSTGGAVDKITAGTGITIAPTTGIGNVTITASPCGGTCIANYVPKFSAATGRIQNSLIYDNGSGVGIGNIAPGTYNSKRYR